MKKILVIEDNEDVRENIAEILELANYEVTTAENGKIGVSLAKEQNPDIIICDIMMPELDGYGVLHILSKDPKSAGIPFIFLTAKAERSDFRKGMNLGADDYITKPFDDVELLDAVESRLKKSEILHSEFDRDKESLHEFLNQASGFRELSELSKGRRMRVFKKKNNLFLEGDLPNYLFFLNKGKIKTFKTNEEGKEYITGLYKEGDFLGYESLLKNSEYTETASALEESEIAIIPRQDFFALLYKNREVAKKFIDILTDKVVEKEKELLKLAYDSVRQRVADALLRVKDRYQEGSESSFSINLSREDLANMVGTATESVIRVLSDLKEEKLVEINAGKLTVKDQDKLRRIVNWNA